MPAPGSPLHQKEIDGVKVIWFRDRVLLDTEELKIIERELFDLVKDQPAFRLVIDFENVQSISSQMLGALLTVHQELKKNKGKLGLCNLHQRILEAFEVTSLKKLFKIHPSQTVAVKKTS